MKYLFCCLLTLNAFSMQKKDITTIILKYIYSQPKKEGETRVQSSLFKLALEQECVKKINNNHYYLDCFDKRYLIDANAKDVFQVFHLTTEGISKR